MPPEQDTPRQAIRRGTSREPIHEPGQRSLDTRLLRMPTECEERDGRGINLGEAPHTERNAIAGIPPTTRTHTVEEHADAQLDPLEVDSLPVDTAVLDCRSAIRLKAVGNTQLVVPPTQLHPYFVGSNRTRWSTARNFQRQNQFASRLLRRLASGSPMQALGLASDRHQVSTARAVTQQPSARLQRRRANFRPCAANPRWRAMLVRGRRVRSCRNARIARQAGSVARSPPSALRPRGSGCRAISISCNPCRRPSGFHPSLIVLADPSCPPFAAARAPDVSNAF